MSRTGAAGSQKRFINSSSRAQNGTPTGGSLAGPTQKNESGQTCIGDLCFTRREILGVLI